MRPNMGSLDRIIRVTAGLALLAFALGLIFPDTGWNWLGWVGAVLIITAAVRVCPAYTLIGRRTSP